MPTLSVEQATAFRLERHHLITRLPAQSLLGAAGACGVQNTPPGSAALSLYARVAELTPRDVDRALYEDRSLLQVWSLRTAPLIFPTADRAVFTLGLLPLDDAQISGFTGGVDPALEKIGLRGVEAAALTATALWDALDGQALTKDELGVDLAARIDPRLSESQRSTWREPSWVAAGQSLGESVVRYLLPVVALQGLCCHAERVGNKAYIRRTDQWVSDHVEQPVSAPVLDPIEVTPSRAQLLRRYLRCYGPSTARHFAEWAGISPVQAEETWALVRGELAEVRLAGKPAWLLAADLPLLAETPAPAGVRFLPPHDPYLQLRDRETLVADAALRREVWRSTGNPGVVLADGQFAGIWRPNKQGNRLKISIRWTLPVSPSIRSQANTEANGFATMIGCTQVAIQESGPTGA